jgi:undecaprenyl-diphosphatase
VVVCVAIFLAGRWVARHQDKVRAFARRQLERPRVAAVRDRYRRQLDFLVARFRPQGAMGLSLTLSLAAIALAGWGLGVLVNEVVSPAARAPFDRPVLDWFVTGSPG